MDNSQNLPALRKQQNKLPTLAELHYDIEKAFKNDKLNLLLNQKPPEQWIQQHPLYGNKYIAIDKVEFLLKRIFQEWRAEVISYSQIFNSVAVHVRLHFRNPITGEWGYQDGLGAVGVQTDKGTSASDLAAIKHNAIMLALPSAESYAIKDAAEKLGTIFGENLTRKDAIDFSPSYIKINKEDERVELMINDCKTLGELEKLKEYCTNDSLVSIYTKKTKELKNETKTK